MPKRSPSPARPPQGDTALVIMAKAPLAGAVKTRLVPALTAGEACGLYECFLRDVAGLVAEVAERESASPIVAFSPAGSEKIFPGLLPSEFRLMPQEGAGLTERLTHVTTRLFSEGYKAVALINADSPTLPRRALEKALRLLRQPGAGVVLGPAEDGGYYLIGMKRNDPRIFENIDWSTERVFEQTLARAKEIGFPVALLPRWYDVDDGKSLARLCKELFPGRRQKTNRVAAHSSEFLGQWLANGGGARLGRDFKSPNLA